MAQPPDATVCIRQHLYLYAQRDGAELAHRIQAGLIAHGSEVSRKS
jgi:hypothetical protein